MRTCHLAVNDSQDLLPLSGNASESKLYHILEYDKFTLDVTAALLFRPVSSGFVKIKLSPVIWGGLDERMKVLTS